MNPKTTGKLYIVATPIGNLSDITFRAIETLKSVNLILAEDTRYTAKLLNHYEIKTPMKSYRDQNHEKVAESIINALKDGLNIALVSDSGTPLISDPGFKLVRAVRNENLELIAIPGPSAGISALSISGLPTDQFLFLGFLPKSTEKQTAIFTQHVDSEASLIIYESPFRIRTLLETVRSVLGDDRQVFLANDLTKLYEKCLYGTVEEVINQIDQTKPKGEFVLIIAKKS